MFCGYLHDCFTVWCNGSHGCNSPRRESRLYNTRGHSTVLLIFAVWCYGTHDCDSPRRDISRLSKTGGELAVGGGEGVGWVRGIQLLYGATTVINVTHYRWIQGVWHFGGWRKEEGELNCGSGVMAGMTVTHTERYHGCMNGEEEALNCSAVWCFGRCLWLTKESTTQQWHCLMLWQMSVTTRRVPLNSGIVWCYGRQVYDSPRRVPLNSGKVWC